MLIKRIIALIVFPMALFIPGIAQVKDGTEPASGSGQRRATYSELSQKVFARRKDANGWKTLRSKAERMDTAEQLHSLVSKGIISGLAVPNASIKDITTQISTVQGERSMSAWDAESTNTPYADSFSINGVRSFAAAYAVLLGNEDIPDTEPYLEFYDQLHGLWELRAQAPTRSDFKGYTFFVSNIKSGVPGETWFIVWGTPLPSNALKVRLYGYDGIAVRTVWKRDALFYGQIAVGPDSITLDHDREYHSSDPDNRVHEVLHVTPNGLE